MIGQTLSHFKITAKLGEAEWVRSTARAPDGFGFKAEARGPGSWRKRIVIS